jgi:HTH-type transcriptional regulator, sugar sensing transcriptional regulator
MLEQNLIALGLSPSEIKVYLHLAKNGSNYAKKISFETKINRTNVYECLDRLIAKGLVASITKNKIKWYEAKTTSAILSLVEQKEQELKSTKNLLEEDIKNFKPNENKKPLEATVFTGKKGLRNVFEEIIELKKPISIIASHLQFQEFFEDYFELWHKKRIQGKIPQRSLFPLELKNKLKKRKMLEYRFIENEYSNPTTTVIYGDNCLFIEWSHEPMAIKIQNSDIVKSHLNYFNLLWKLAKD